MYTYVCFYSPPYCLYYYAEHVNKYFPFKFFCDIIIIIITERVHVTAPLHQRSITFLLNLLQFSFLSYYNQKIEKNNPRFWRLETDMARKLTACSIKQR